MRMRMQRSTSSYWPFAVLEPMMKTFPGDQARAEQDEEEHERLRPSPSRSAKTPSCASAYPASTNPVWACWAPSSGVERVFAAVSSPTPTAA